MEIHVLSIAQKACEMGYLNTFSVYFLTCLCLSRLLYICIIANGDQE